MDFLDLETASLRNWQDQNPLKKGFNSKVLSIIRLLIKEPLDFG